ncbi:hypothetical protein AB0C96_20450 [Streptomyces sp. NPDC048506]|uniref:hypothetical protein n=1 Tax=Streptomyces sp. NPDC048506 TaxID=3155028 RepID=UPI003448C9B8
MPAHRVRHRIRRTDYSTDEPAWAEVGTATLPKVTATQDMSVFINPRSTGTRDEANRIGFAQS